MNNSIEISVDFNEIHELIQKFPSVLELGWKYVAVEFWGNIRKEAPVDHGRLAGSFALEQEKPLVWHIKSAVEYAFMVYSGTAVRGDTSLGASGVPYDIFPVNKKALWWKGLAHPVKAVYGHPGMKGDRYVDRAEQTTIARVDEFINRAMQEMGVA